MSVDSPILFSLQSAAHWFDTLPGRYALERLIFENSAKCDGYEFGVPHANLENLASKGVLPGALENLSAASKKAFFASARNTIHLDDMKALPPGREPWLAEQLGRIRDSLGISDFTIHPDESQAHQWQGLFDNLPDGLTVSLENMCKRKKSFKELSEIGAILDKFEGASVTFDLCHWLELGRTENDAELKDFFDCYHNRISKIHFSVPYSAADFYRGLDHLCHFLYFQSNYCNLQSLYQLVAEKAAWIVEGFVPIGCTGLVKSELRHLRSSLRNAQYPTAVAI